MYKKNVVVLTGPTAVGKTALSIALAKALDTGIISADSMKSRGYGMAGRTAYSIYRFEKRDGIALLVLFLLTLGTVLPWAAGWLSWEYYPMLTGTLAGPVEILAYCCYSGACLLPLAIDFVEDQKWNSLRSKI